MISLASDHHHEASAFWDTPSNGELSISKALHMHLQQQGEEERDGAHSCPQTTHGQILSSPPRRRVEQWVLRWPAWGQS